MMRLFVRFIEALHVELAVVLYLEGVAAGQHLHLAVQAAEGIRLFGKFSCKLVKNFAYIYKQGVEEEMMSALELCNQNFKTDWGQKLVNVLRAIHEVKYSFNDIDDEDYIQ